MRFMHRAVATGTLAALVATLSQSLYASDRPRLEISAGLEANAVRVIGAMREEIWETAKPISDFVQREPHEGAPPSQRTEFRVAYDAATIYVRVRAFDTEPGKIVGHLTRRDATSPSDWIRSLC